VHGLRVAGARCQRQQTLLVDTQTSVGQRAARPSPRPHPPCGETTRQHRLAAKNAKPARLTQSTQPASSKTLPAGAMATVECPARMGRNGPGRADANVPTPWDCGQRKRTAPRAGEVLDDAACNGTQHFGCIGGSTRGGLCVRLRSAAGTVVTSRANRSGMWTPQFTEARTRPYWTTRAHLASEDIEEIARYLAHTGQATAVVTCRVPMTQNQTGPSGSVQRAWLMPGEALADFIRVYEDNLAALVEEGATLCANPEIAQVVRAATGEGHLTAEKQMLRMALTGDWGPIDALLRAKGRALAGLNVTFMSCVETHTAATAPLTALLVTEYGSPDICVGGKMVIISVPSSPVQYPTRCNRA